MAIKANNIVVGGEVKSSPPQPEVKKAEKAGSISAKSFVILSDTPKKEAPKKIIHETQNVLKTKELPKYIEKEDGLLVRKINTKSGYMRDIFELDS